MQTVLAIRQFIYTAFIFFVFSLSYKGFAQLNLEFKHIQEKDGLSNNVVTNLLKDKNGFVWVGTYDGLNRFDGNHFLKFKKKRNESNSLIDNAVYDLALDVDGDVWYATAAGLGCYHQKNNTFENFDTDGKAPLGQIFNILCDKNDDVWFTSGLGLFRLDKKTRKLDLFKNETTKASSMLEGIVSRNGLIEDASRSGFWLTSSSGLMYFDLRSKQFFHHKNNPKQLEVFKNENTSAIARSSQNQIAFGTFKDQIVIFDGVTGKITKKHELKSSRVVMLGTTASLFFDNQQNLWASSWVYTLFLINAKTQQVTEFFNDKADRNSFSSDFFFAGLQESDGTLMFGTMNGISYTNPESAFYKVYKINKKQPNLEFNFGILSVEEDKGHWWWLGTHKDGLLHYNTLTDSLEVYSFENRVNSVKELQNRLYIASNAGFYSFDKKTEKFTEIPLPEEVIKNQRNIVSFFSPNDSTLWISGYGKYILKFNVNSKQFDDYDLEKNIGTQKLKGSSSVFVDKNKGIWASNWGGVLFQFSEKNRQFFPQKSFNDTKFDANFNLPVVDKNNDFWIAAPNKGLVKYDSKPQKYEFWSESEGLVSDIIWSVNVDNFGQVWSAITNKFSIFNPTRGSFLNLTLPINEINYNYYNELYRLKNGHIVSTQQWYLVEFFPERINQYALTNAPLINHIYFADAPMIYTANSQSVSLDVEQNGFSIGYGYLPLSPINKYQYMYKLEGFDKNWVKAGEETSANYSNLEGGDYTFMVKAINGDAVSKVAQIRIHISTVFYKTWWFRLLVMIAFGTILYLFVNYRASQRAKIHYLQIQSTRLEKDKTEIQYQNLINHLNPHFLFNSLTSLNSLIITEPKVASKFLQKLSAMYRYILQSKDKETVTIEQEINFVNNYIDLQKSRFEDGLQININIDEQYLDCAIIPVTLQNMFENAIKHNIIEDENPLVIDVYVDGDFLIVKNNLQRKGFVETSNKQGLDSLKTLYSYLSPKPFETIETETEFIVKVPLV